MAEQKTLLEKFISDLNADVFLREFAFSSSEIRLEGVGDIEIADHLVFLDNHALVFQLKERDRNASLEQENLAAWFENKVMKKAVTQICDTLKYLAEHEGVSLENDRGHTVSLPNPERGVVSAIVVYDPVVETEFHPPRGYESRRAGFVHFIEARDYFGVCKLLATPTEIVDYLRFRRSLFDDHSSLMTQVSESALVAQYILEVEGPPSERYTKALSALQERRSEWDISFLTGRLGDQIVFRRGDQSATSYYRILSELGKLSRTELRALKERFVQCLEVVRADRFALPYRFAVPRTDCGFLILPVLRENKSKTEQGLSNLSVASKYEFGTRKHIGLAVSTKGEYIDILWMFIESEVRPDPELDKMLKENYPFRETSEKLIPRYLFSEEELLEILGSAE